MRQANVVRVGEASLWRSEHLYVMGTLFVSSMETLACYPRSRLAQLLSPPYPILDPARDAHIIPSTLCDSAEAFAIILEYLRGPPQWPTIPSLKLHEQVTQACTHFGIPTPPPPYVALDVALQVERYDQVEVLMVPPMRPLPQHERFWSSTDPSAPLGSTGDVLNPAHYLLQATSNNAPFFMGGGEGSPRRAHATHSCALLSTLATKGYEVVKEMSAMSSAVARRSLEAHVDGFLVDALGHEVVEQSTTDEKAWYAKLLQRNASAVVLQRRRVMLPIVDQLSTTSSWFGALTDAS